MALKNSFAHNKEVPSIFLIPTKSYRLSHPVAFFYSKSSVINDFKQFYFEIQA